MIPLKCEEIKWHHFNPRNGNKVNCVWQKKKKKEIGTVKSTCLSCLCWIAWFTRSNSCLAYSVSTHRLFKSESPCRIWNRCVKEWLGIPKDGHNQFIYPNNFWKSFKVFKESVWIYIFCSLIIILCNI